ncbi:hypothetical protein CLTEP_04420 [Clostridium tepidiprofundi DSM 19306]|uniref:DUF6873 domain-containing protein n=1 Tax=Clostridium tepidiprofundi DSM 19306 TaxID=1121338 RepID=A0A151B6S6_9CLOT|nr:hypothetical protein [Clostridium tepidiprofundi]KYH35503.1 hypothetical protein CLTEP_04420 [Clostridium tepidiprofundi DSM 19306]
MKHVLVDFRIDSEETNSLEKLNYNIIKCPPCNRLYEAVCGHPDMLLHKIDYENIIVHKDMPSHFINLLKKLNYNVIKSHSILKPIYPHDILLNAVNLHDYFIHKLYNTDIVLKKFVKNKTLINVKQGYTKCSTAIVTDTAIITSDPSINAALSNTKIDILFLPPGDILLPGLDYGFIGGTCGLLDDNHLAFYGNLKYYKYGKEVIKFLEKHNVEPVFLREGKLVDRGSIFRI